MTLTLASLLNSIMQTAKTVASKLSRIGYLKLNQDHVAASAAWGT
jgi:hypothetical protein